MRRFLRSHWRVIAAASLTLPIVAFIAICLAIGSGVRAAIADARSHHPGEPISALLAVAADGNLAPAVRNRAIWALGQLGRSEAVPVLNLVGQNGVFQRQMRNGQRPRLALVDLVLDGWCAARRGGD